MAAFFYWDTASKWFDQNGRQTRTAQFSTALLPSPTPTLQVCVSQAICLIFYSTFVVIFAN